MHRNIIYDRALLALTVYLVGFGLLAIYSASFPDGIANHADQGFYYVARQAVAIVIGCIALFVLARLNERLFLLAAWILYGVSIALMLVAIAKGGDRAGNTAWLTLPFGFSMQPSELLKPALIMVLAMRVRCTPSAPTVLGTYLGMLLIAGVPLGVVLYQRDLGTATIIVLALLLFLALAGAPFRFWGVTLLLFLGIAGVAVMSGSRRGRVIAVFKPFDTSIYASGQPRNSLIAVGSGGLTGVGVGRSRQKWGYLAENHNDYIAAIIAEELGFVRIVLLLLLPYSIFISLGFAIAHRAPGSFFALLAGGVTIMIAVQALINLLVVTNLFPCMGINLPFISYGGTSILSTLMMVGLLLNASRPPAAATTPNQRLAPAGGRA